MLLLLVNTNFPAGGRGPGLGRIAWANLAYLLVTIPLLVRRRAGWPEKTASGRNGRCSLSVNGAWPSTSPPSFWGTLTVVNMAWPGAGVYGDGAWYQHMRGRCTPRSRAPRHRVLWD